MNILRKSTPKGIRSVLTYWYRGQRYRPVLGYNLTADQEREVSLDIITTIHSNTDQQIISRAETHVVIDLTLAGFIPTYLQYLNAKRPNHDGRNEIILANPSSRRISKSRLWPR